MPPTVPRASRLALLVVLVAGGCAAPARVVDAPTAAERAVIATTQRLFDAMQARDSTALRALLHPEAQVLLVGPDGAVTRRDAGTWIQSVAASPDVLRERMADPRVEVAGDLATLWAPYVFHRGERFSHCGTDAFQFVRDGSGWRFVVVSFTRETEGCAAEPASR